MIKNEGLKLQKLSRESIGRNKKEKNHKPKSNSKEKNLEGLKAVHNYSNNIWMERGNFKRSFAEELVE